MIDKKSILSSIPSVDELMKDKELERLAVLYSRTAVVEGIREYLGEYRKYVMSAKKDEELDAVNGSDIMKGIIEKIHNMMRNNLVNVVNATGVVLHTNLGRSPLSSRLKDTLWLSLIHI